MVGAKNMASSSGCAIRRHILLFRNLGNLERATDTVYSQQDIVMIGSAKMVSHCIVARTYGWDVEDKLIIGRDGRDGQDVGKQSDVFVSLGLRGD